MFAQQLTGISFRYLRGRLSQRLKRTASIKLKLLAADVYSRIKYMLRILKKLLTDLNKTEIS